GDEQGGVGPLPQTQVVQLLRVALDDLEARLPAADRRDHLALPVGVVLGDELVELCAELAHGPGALRLAPTFDDVLEGARRAHPYSSLGLVRSPSFERLRRM